MPIPEKYAPAVPPVSLIPIHPVVVEHSSVTGWKICATWNQGIASGSIGHLYALDVLAAAAADHEVWQALAEATLAGLCTRCTTRLEAEHLIDLYVRPVVVERAAEFVWAHAPVIGVECGGCAMEVGAAENG